MVTFCCITHCMLLWCLAGRLGYHILSKAQVAMVQKGDLAICILLGPIAIGVVGYMWCVAIHDELVALRAMRDHYAREADRKSKHEDEP